MARTEERIRTIDRAVDTPPSPEVARGKPRMGLALAWLVGFPLSVALQPAAAVSDATWLDYIVSYALLASIGVTLGGIATRKPWAAGASLGASGLVLASTFACPATGHHAFGLWWFGQLAIALTLVAVSGISAWRGRGTT